ncbi:MAG: response regulator [Lachnospiraceae bacterium]|nr:response regulator [Lachnospiraceae bacterium]
MEKVLIIDDNSINLKMASMALKEVCKPVPVPSGEMALKFLSTNRPALVLLDIEMPDMDGFETLKAIRKIPDMAELPVIFLSASTDDETRDSALAAGGADYVVKPFRKEELLKAVQPHLM